MFMIEGNLHQLKRVAFQQCPIQNTLEHKTKTADTTSGGSRVLVVSNETPFEILCTELSN